MRDFVLPSGWVRATFDEVANARMGKTILAKELAESGLPVFSAATDNTPWGYTQDESVVFERGTIIISARGTIGAAKLPRFDRFVSTQTTIAATPHQGVDPKFLNFQLAGVQWSEFTSTTAIPMLTITALHRLPLKVAPLNEQRRIVEKIETLFARLDQGEAALRQTQKLLARYRQSVLKAAVTGALTADWRAQNAHRLEHGRDLLARILQTRRQTWQGRGKYQEPAAPDTTHLPELPEGWVWASFEQLCEAKSDGGKKLPQKQFLNSGLLPVIDQGETDIGGYSNDETLAYEGALPVIIFGDHTRRFKLVRDRFVCGADGVKIIEPSRCLPVEYLYILLTSAKFDDRGYSRHFQFVRRLLFPWRFQMRSATLG